MDCSICYYAAKHLILLFLTGTQTEVTPKWTASQNMLNFLQHIVTPILYTSHQLSNSASSFFCQFRQQKSQRRHSNVVVTYNTHWPQTGKDDRLSFLWCLCKFKSSFARTYKKTCEALRRTTAGESIRIIWKENKSDRWMKIWQKSESKTLKLSTSTSHSHAEMTEMTDSGLFEQQLLPCDKHPFIAHITSVLLSFCFLCNSCLLISVVYLKNYLWRVTWITNRVKRICQRRCSMIHFSTNTTTNITAWKYCNYYNCHGKPHVCQTCILPDYPCQAV